MLILLGTPLHVAAAAEGPLLIDATPVGTAGASVAFVRPRC